MRLYIQHGSYFWVTGAGQTLMFHPPCLADSRNFFFGRLFKRKIQFPDNVKFGDILKQLPASTVALRCRTVFACAGVFATGRF